MGVVTAAVTAALAVAGAYQSYDANQKAAGQEKENAQENARILAIREKEALRIGSQEAGAYRRNIDKLKGTQSANTAASGVVVGVGSNADVRSETEQLAQEDIGRIKNNAMLEAWGYKTQATNLLKQADFNATAYRNQGTASLLGGISSAVGAFKGSKYNTKTEDSGSN